MKKSQNRESIEDFYRIIGPITLQCNKISNTLSSPDINFGIAAMC